MKNLDKYIDSPLNRSPSKQAHVFPRATRFQRSRHLQTQVKYTLPSTLQKKSCSFGFGNKSNIIVTQCAPPPGSYESSSQFNQSSKKYKLPSFGFSRQSVMFGSYLVEAQKKGVKMPSPNKYDIKLPKTKIGGKMGIRINTELGDKQKNRPSPAHYNVPLQEMSTSFILSQYKNPSSPKYYKTKTIDTSHVRNKSKTEFYEVAEKQFGKSRVSRFKNAVKSSFGKQKKMSIVDKQKLKIPGFKYSIFSEFGTLQ